MSRVVLRNGMIRRLILCALVFGSLGYPLCGYTPYHGFSFSAEPFDKKDASGHFVQDFKRDYYFNFYNVVQSVPMYIMVWRSYRGKRSHHEYQVSGARKAYSTHHADFYGLQVPLSGGRVVVSERLKAVPSKAGAGKKEENKRKKLCWPNISVSDPLPLCINFFQNPVSPTEKTTTGMLIPLNDDDDDRNGRKDYQDATNKGEENDLVMVTVQHPPGLPISLSWNPAVVRLYKTPSKKNKRGYSSLMGNGNVSYKGYDNQAFYVEGVALGATFLTLTGPGGFSDRLKITVTKIGIAMDGNRDTIISLDSTGVSTNDNHYLFWVNDDRDQMHYEEMGWHEDDVSVDGNPDCDNDTIGDKTWSKSGCRRDLEDFTRLHILVDDNAASLPGVSYYLKFDHSFGTPQANLFEAVNESLDYLRYGSVADKQIKKKRLLTIGAQECRLANKYIKTGNQRSCFILEGKRIGKGDLTLIIKQNGAEICRKAVALELRPISWFYEVFEVGAVGQNSQLVGNYHSDFTKSSDYLLFVHGFNVDQIEKTCWPATIFKRLWWLNYKGHVGFFDWPCALMDINNRKCYDDSEYNAWRCGGALLDRINQLNSGGHSGKVRLLAHSQGNVVAGEALRLASGQVVHTYIATQAAVPADCYQGGLPTYLDTHTMPNVFVKYPPTSNPYLMGVSSKAGQMFSYYNVEDFALRSAALGSWEWNNAHRPDATYDYKGSPAVYDISYRPMPSRFYCVGPPSLRILAFTNDTYEIFSYAAQAREAALGVQSNINDFALVNLQGGALNYGRQRYSHSRQFRSNIVDEKAYWVSVCRRCGFLYRITE